MTQSRWKLRQARTKKLTADHPHAEELLEFYGQVLELQEPLCREAGRARWPSPEIRASDGEDGPYLRLERLTGDLRDRAFRLFITRVSAVATNVLASIAERLQSADANTRADLLEGFLARRSLDEAATALACKTPPLEFFPRAFMQPVAEALLEKLGRRPDAAPDEGSGQAQCPQCGWPPILAVLRDEPEVKGRRLLVCSLCSSEWTFPRSRCPSCGEARADRLQYHVTDFWPHVRIEECGTCRTYIKSVDLRADGRAVPVVDELASVELDLWAGDAGLTKLQRNLLGL